MATFKDLKSVPGTRNVHEFAIDFSVRTVKFRMLSCSVRDARTPCTHYEGEIYMTFDCFYTRAKTAKAKCEMNMAENGSTGSEKKSAKGVPKKKTQNKSDKINIQTVPLKKSRVKVSLGKKPQNSSAEIHQRQVKINDEIDHDVHNSGQSVQMKKPSRTKKPKQRP